jgi:hypothetical protein
MFFQKLVTRATQHNISEDGILHKEPLMCIFIPVDILYVLLYHVPVWMTCSPQGKTIVKNGGNILNKHALKN